MVALVGKSVRRTAGDDANADPEKPFEHAPPIEGDRHGLVNSKRPQAYSASASFAGSACSASVPASFTAANDVSRRRGTALMIVRGSNTRPLLKLSRSRPTGVAK